MILFLNSAVTFSETTHKDEQKLSSPYLPSLILRQPYDGFKEVRQMKQA